MVGSGASATFDRNHHERRAPIELAYEAMHCFYAL
jgi:hypothetical protein